MKKIDFIENKILNFENLKKIYQISYKKNRHANFGPISLKLEKYLMKIMKIPKNKTVIMCSSGTMAMQTICNYFRQNNKNKFATSNLTFFSNNISFLNNAKILNTNKEGLLDLSDAIKNRNSFDNLIFTNVFNIKPEYDAVYKFCNKYKKNLIIDNALTLFERPKNFDKMKTFEIVSFHHTKPWGFGEGGAIICHKKHEKTMRNLINFGSNNFSKFKKFSTNAKISDLACAAIFLRIKNIKIWSKEYKFQCIRIKKIIEQNFNFNKILYNSNSTPVAYLPVIFKKKINKVRFNKAKYLNFRKYYIPLQKKKKINCNAKKIYDNILCIPTHGGLKNLSDNRIIADLKKLVN